MGLIKSAMTIYIGYYLIEIFKKNKDKLKNIPFISDFMKKYKDKNISIETYLLLFFFGIKDFLI